MTRMSHLCSIYGYRDTFQRLGEMSLILSKGVRIEKKTTLRICGPSDM